MSKITDDFIKSIQEAAIDSTNGTGLFPSVVIAQAILESASGQSKLAAQYKNYFGIKDSKAWTGKVVNLKTREVIKGVSGSIIDGFRVYDSVEESFADRTKFLLQNPRYAKANVFKAKTPQEQAKALQAAGYATDPNYAATIQKVIAAWNLTSFDKKKVQ